MDKTVSVFDEIANNASDNVTVVMGSKSYRERLVRAQVEERERIIALLEAWVTDDNGNFDETLALIKGEQK